MRHVLISCVLLAAHALANDDVQYVKSVKGGHGGGGFQYNAGENLVRLFGNNTQYGQGQGASYQGAASYGMRHNLTQTIDYEVGVCYVEVPTASLVRDTSHVPAGNGSRPDLSRIRTCCKGYIRNIHNYKICEPVCSHECVNALCTAPEVCTCFPDHVKNLAGFCVPTCPIGCQNGHCSGGECLCKDGYKLDSESKFCLPSCRENCGGIGNCTAPNTCECKTGYKSTPEGSCKAVCDHCINGDCVAPNECRCHQGYVKDQQGKCIPHCPQGCGPNGNCASPNVCTYPPNSGIVPSNQYANQPANQHSNQPGNPSYPPSNQPPYQTPNTSYHPQNQPSNYPYAPNQASNNPYSPNQPSNYPYPSNNVPSNEAQCSQPCINGACVDGNRCACNVGYVLDRSDPTGTRCVPNCPGGCPNGVCSAPNFCICNMGYYKDHSVKGRPACVKRIRRSADIGFSPDPKKPINVAELLTFEIPDY